MPKSWRILELNSDTTEALGGSGSVWAPFFGLAWQAMRATCRLTIEGLARGL